MYIHSREDKESPEEDSRRGTFQGAYIGTFDGFSPSELSEMGMEIAYPELFERSPSGELIWRPV